MTPAEPQTDAAPAAAWRPAVVLPPSAVALGKGYDRWAHRRGEPRLFVLLWTSYLFAATILTLASVGGAGYVPPEVYRTAARILLVLLVAGMTVVWPMIRLSQASPERGGFAPTVQDLLIVLAPAQAVVWPQWLLAGWSLEVVGALSAMLAAWGLLAGSVLALVLSMRPAGAGARVAWMVFFVALTLAGSLPALLERADSLPDASSSGRAAWMLSPVTAVYEITRDRAWTGRVAEVGPVHWIAAAWTAGASLPIWAVAASWSRGRRSPDRLH